MDNPGDLSRMDTEMKYIYGLPVPMRPIAYNEETVDHSYIFETHGVYYHWSPLEHRLLRLNGVFTDETVLCRWMRDYTDVGELAESDEESDAIVKGV